MTDEDARTEKRMTRAVELLRSRFNANEMFNRQIAEFLTEVELVKTSNGPIPPDPTPADAGPEPPIRDSPHARPSCICNFCRDNTTEIVVDKII